MADEPRDVSQEEYNKKVTQWGEATGRKLRGNLAMVANKGKGDLLKSLRLKTGKWFGEVDKLAYHFLRHGVFLHKGVGRGYAMVGGKVMRVSGSAQAAFLKEYARVKNRSVERKPIAGNKKRQAVEWFNPILEREMPDLADMVTMLNADRVVAGTKIFIR